MAVIQNIKDVWSSIYYIGVVKKNKHHSISDVVRINKIEWVTARNCLEFLVWAGLAIEKKEVVNGRYCRLFKGVKRRDVNGK
jgi:hypothetical protein